VQTGGSNVTRFLALKSAATAPEFDYTMPKTSIVVDPGANCPGLLRKILEPFEKFGVNVCRLESRPSEDLWSYRFFLDLLSPEGQRGSRDGAQCVAAALRDLETQGVAVRVLVTTRCSRHERRARSRKIPRRWVRRRRTLKRPNKASHAVIPARGCKPWATPLRHCPCIFKRTGRHIKDPSLAEVRT
jgi:hypothetical protein